MNDLEKALKINLENNVQFSEYEILDLFTTLIMDDVSSSERTNEEREKLLNILWLRIPDNKKIDIIQNKAWRDLIEILPYNIPYKEDFIRLNISECLKENIDNPVVYEEEKENIINPEFKGEEEYNLLAAANQDLIM